MSRVRLDLTNPEFQKRFLKLGKEDQRRVSGGEMLYSLRMGKGFRAVAFREKDWLRLVSLHPDHDSAYR